jgi:hypothetical protein
MLPPLGKCFAYSFTRCESSSFIFDGNKVGGKLTKRFLSRAYTFIVTKPDYYFLVSRKTATVDSQNFQEFKRTRKSPTGSKKNNWKFQCTFYGQVLYLLDPASTSSLPTVFKISLKSLLTYPYISLVTPNSHSCNQVFRYNSGNFDILVQNYCCLLWTSSKVDLTCVTSGPGRYKRVEEKNPELQIWVQARVSPMFLSANRCVRLLYWTVGLIQARCAKQTTRIPPKKMYIPKFIFVRCIHSMRCLSRRCRKRVHVYYSICGLRQFERIQRAATAFDKLTNVTKSSMKIFLIDKNVQRRWK